MNWHDIAPDWVAALALGAFCFGLLSFASALAP